jgi:chemotaxis methyl-accepting protein methylase
LPGDTAFFRYPGALETLEKRILPELKRRKKEDNPRSLRIWSAGCSTGEEAFSIAIAVCEALNGEGGGWNIHIVASDIRQEALASAERGLYPQRALENVPRHLITTYFSRIGDHFLVKPRLLNLVTFTPMNLAQASFIGRFDCIFCMNVMPHFSLSQRTALLQRLHLYLEPGGYLFLGQNEKLPAADVNFSAQSYLSCTYYQRPIAAAAKSGK